MLVKALIMSEKHAFHVMIKLSKTDQPVVDGAESEQNLKSVALEPITSTLGILIR